MFRPTKNKVILSLLPFTIALAAIPLHLWSQGSNIPIPIVIPLLVFGAVISNVLVAPFKLILVVAGWDPATTLSITYHLVISGIYACLIYIFLSLRQTRQKRLGTLSSKDNSRQIFNLRPSKSGLVLILLPLLMAYAYVFYSSIVLLDYADLFTWPTQLYFLGTFALSIVIFVTMPFSAPFETIFTPMGLWDDPHGMPNTLGVYLVAITYSIAIFIITSIYGLLRSLFKQR